MPKPSTPLWRQVFNGWEKAVAPGLERLTASSGFRDALAVGLRANAEVAREVERASRQWLHLWNLPASSDVRSLRKQVASLEREVLNLRLQLQSQPLPRSEPEYGFGFKPTFGFGFQPELEPEFQPDFEPSETAT